MVAAAGKAGARNTLSSDAIVFPLTFAVRDGRSLYERLDAAHCEPVERVDLLPCVLSGPRELFRGGGA